MNNLLYSIYIFYFQEEIPGTQNNITLTNLTACTKYRISITSVSHDLTYSSFIIQDFETLSVGKWTLKFNVLSFNY